MVGHFHLSREKDETKKTCLSLSPYDCTWNYFAPEQSITVSSNLGECEQNSYTYPTPSEPEIPACLTSIGKEKYTVFMILFIISIIINVLLISCSKERIQKYFGKKENIFKPQQLNDQLENNLL